jgi:hypothetical protein
VHNPLPDDAGALDLSALPQRELPHWRIVHAAILWFILPTSLVAVTLGCWRHKDRYVLALCAIGLAVIVVAARFGDALFGEPAEMVLTSVGSSLLIAGHFRNFGLCRVAACDE